MLPFCVRCLPSRPASLLPALVPSAAAPSAMPSALGAPHPFALSTPPHARQQVRWGANKRIRWTGKKGNKNFYKGTRSGAMGHYDASGRYIIDPWKVRDYVVPDLSNFKLTPFVSPKVDASKDHVPRYTYKDVLSQSEEGQEAMDKVSRQQLDQALAQIAEWARKRAADPHPRQYGVEKPPLL